MTTIFPKANYTTALILILLIAVPFLIALLTVYILFGGQWNDSEACATMCSVKPPNDLFFKQRTMTEEEHLANMAKIDKDDLLNPSIGALLTPELVLVCPVALVSMNWVMTIEKCVKSDKKPEDFRIRLYSNYSSQKGVIKKVQEIKKIKTINAPYHFILLKFNPTKLEEEKLIVPLHMVASKVAVLKNLRLYYYGKDNKLKFFKVNRVPKHCCINPQYQNQTICTVQSYGRCSYEENALLVSEDYLSGIQYESACANKICYILDTFNCKTKEWKDLGIASS